MFDQSNQNPMMGGYQFNGYPVQQQPKVMNYLTADEIKSLQAKESTFNLMLTEVETLQARCNHRTADGMADTLKIDPVTGETTCTICGYKFRPLDPDTSKEAIEDAKNQIINILQTIKILYTDLPAQAANEYFQIIPLIDKIPKLFEFAAKSFNKHEYNAWQYNNMSMGGMAMLNNLQAAFGGFGMQQPAYQQPMMGGYQQPMYNPAAAPQPGMNPFAAQQPMMGGYQPQSTGFAYQPQQAAPAPAAPAAPTAAPAADVTVTNTVTV